MEQSKLSDSEREKIAEEEAYRAEIRRKQERKKTSPAAWGCLIVFLVFFFSLLIAVFSSDSETSTTSQEEHGSSRETITTGEDGILNSNESLTDCSGQTAVGVTADDIQALTDAATADNQAYFTDLALQGRIFLVNNCTPIRKVDSGGTLGSLAKIDILSPETGLAEKSGWVPYEFAKKSSDTTAAQ